ncbi:phosphatidylinositol-specific phospholipase C1-like protein [Goodfellowiella coeruleoviolacea]|uniref:LigA protein n=1 Tax=Goodfellowiella coeruleoviolacea TaxID=334858 RepID=A0AAE3KGH0_9PSEU|nr:phosphatidylinositol-specific phospholipase C1-like protein [Goodfellowiella coeruleoviolacea]MCP2167241.1 hypothetical protein [Goodfellowiella coeruleoviolacea]
MEEIRTETADHEPEELFPLDSGEPDDTPVSEEQVLAFLKNGAPARDLAQAQAITDLLGRGRVDNANIFRAGITVHGDFVAGTVRRTRTRRPTVIPIGSSDLAEIDDYVRPDDFQDCVVALADLNVVVLAGPVRTGRRSRALAMLVELLGRTAPDIVELPGSTLRARPWRPPARGRGILVVDEPVRGEHAAHHLDDSWLNHAREVLGEQSRFLVVVTGPPQNALGAAAGRFEHVLEDLALPDPMQIVRKWVLPRVAGLTDTRFDEVVTRTQLGDLLAERDDPRFANKVARVVAESIRTGSDLRQDLARLRNPHEQVAEWLSTNRDASEIAIVAATAVLEQATYLQVVDAAVRLRSALGRSPEITLQYSRQLVAERTWIERTAHADGRETLSFRHDDLRQAVLARLWLQLDGARGKIVRWLSELAGHPDVEIRARAADAAGVLAAVDFAHGLHQLFLPWAANKAATLRQSAALGLNVAGGLSGRVDAFWDHIQRWADQLESTARSRYLADTAAMAACGRLGVAAPPRALKILHTLVRNQDWASLPSVSVGACTLVEAGVTTPVLRALLDWSGPAADERSAAKALTVFTYTVRHAKGSGEALPILLGDYAKHHDLLPELWARALASGERVRELAETALREWVGTADRVHRTRPLLLDLLAGIADRGEDDFTRLKHLLAGWALDADTPSPAAAEFHDRLLEAEEQIA